MAYGDTKKKIEEGIEYIVGIYSNINTQVCPFVELRVGNNPVRFIIRLDTKVNMVMDRRNTFNMLYHPRYIIRQQEAIPNPPAPTLRPSHAGQWVHPEPS